MEKTRRFSLENDFMNYSIDDLLFGIMCHLATYHPKEERIYLTKQNLSKNRKVIYNCCNLNSRTLKSHIDKLIEKGLVKEEDVDCGNAVYPCYTFPYDYDTNYQIVDWELLWYLISTRNKGCIQVYIYLINKYLWKEKSEEKYVFTNKELQVALGYSPNTELADSFISNILESMAREGIIKFEEFYAEQTLDNGEIVPKPQKKLLFVAKRKSDLKQF